MISYYDDIVLNIVADDAHTEILAELASLIKNHRLFRIKIDHIANRMLEKLFIFYASLLELNNTMFVMYLAPHSILQTHN